jgi:hypothetical protein
LSKPVLRVKLYLADLKWELRELHRGVTQNLEEEEVKAGMWRLGGPCHLDDDIY